MKKIYTNKLFLTAFSLFTIIALMSNSSGRGNIFGQAVSGAPGDSNLTCASSGCHSAGTFSPSAELEVKNADGNVVTSFTPGETYDVSLTVNASGSPSAFGFQMVALKDDNSAATEWSDLSSNVQSVQINSRDYIEHDSPSSDNQFNVKWTAPDSGSGDVTFYFSANAVNGNGSPSGDGGTNSTFVLSELTTSSNDLAEASISLYPIPATDFITVSGLDHDLKYTIYDIQGQKVINSSDQGNSTIDISQLELGLYFIGIQSNDKVITKKFIKK